MKSIVKALGATALGLLLTATAGSAQSSSAGSSTPITWNAGVGLSMPSTSGFNTGFNFRLGATVPVTGSPVWIRPEAGFDHVSVSCTGCGSLNLFAVGADAGYTFETTGSVGAYVLGGLQITHQSYSVSGYSASLTRLGINLGGGMTFPLGGKIGYLELRYVSAGNSFDMFPLTFGLRF